MAIPPPRPAREGDSAKAEWVGQSCTVLWPAAAGPIGLDSIEYQVMVIADSQNLPPRIGAMLITASAASKKDEGLETRQPSIKKDPTSGLRAMEKHVDGHDSRPSSPNEGAEKLSRIDQPVPPTAPKKLGGRAMRTLAMMGGGKHNEVNAGQMVSVDLRDLCVDLRYGFEILARYPTVGPRSFTKIFEIPKTTWRPTALVTAMALHKSVHNADNGHRAPPMPEQMASPEDGRLKRWYDSCFVLLTWPGLEVSETKASGYSSQYELQASEVSDLSSFTDDSNTASQADGRSWWPCTSTKGLVLDGVPCLAVRDLPFLVGQFRLFDASQQRAGPLSRLMISLYEAVPAPAAQLQALGKIAPRTLAIKLNVSLAAPGGTQQRASLQQVRYRAVGTLAGAAAGRWEELEHTSLDMSKGNEVTILVREEDGLELGPAYEFCVRVGDSCRLGPWSEPSKPQKFAVAPPVPPEANGISVGIDVEHVKLSWPPFGPEAELAVKMPGFMKLPIEYTVAVYGGAAEEPVATFVTRETQASVRALAPGTAYSAVLSARWTRFGAMGPDGSASASSEERKKTSLMAAFVTPQSQKKVVAELSLRGFGDKMTGAGQTATATFALDSSSNSAVKLDLDPYYGSVQPQHTSMVSPLRKPTSPLSTFTATMAREGYTTDGAPRSTQAEAGAMEGAITSARGATATEEPPLSGRPLLPTLVPMPPPKFTTRDPVSYGPLIDLSSPHRPSLSKRFGNMR